MNTGDSQYFSNSQNNKVDAIRKQLDGNNIKEKFAAMKKIVAMMSKGTDVEELFPYVVKNVICKHLDVKKLVYTYLIHYAEKQPDEALLSVNNFQKDLNDKNQFFRALALRILSSIRVPIIAPIIVASIKKCSTDMSPFVRKAACLAIPKAYQMDLNLKDELKNVIEKLLSDTNTMVLGAAVFAFNEVCPNSWELIHPNYRKLCKYLVDCDEWGQIVIITMLLRYARTQFLSPFKDNAYQKQSFYEEDEEDGADPLDKSSNSNPVEFDLDADHRLLIRSASPLLRTSNAAVVLAVSSLFFHIAPPAETAKVVRPMLRLVRGDRECQYIALTNIASMAKERPQMFQPFIKDFYIYATDAMFVKKMKLEILALIAHDSNVHALLKEFKAYVKFPEEEFVCDTIQTIGRVATTNSEIMETCMAGLMNLIRSKSERVVGESVIVMRYLLQKNPKEHSKIISKMATLLEHVKVPVARSSIIWMIGEYYDIIPKIGPDALRILAKSFVNEDDTVKLQTLNLGTKLYLRLGEKISLLYQYVLTLARYDTNYDIRDRARFFRTILYNPKGNVTTLAQRANDIIFGQKSASTTLQSAFHDRSRFAISSLSHLVNHFAFGYEPLPEFPEKQPDPTVRKTMEDIPLAETQTLDKDDGSVDFYKEKDGSNEDYSLEGFYDKESADPWADVGDDEEEEEEEEEDQENDDEEEEEEEDQEDQEEDEEDQENDEEQAETDGEEEQADDDEEEEDASEEEELPPAKPAAKSTTKQPSPALLDMTDQFFGSNASVTDAVLKPTTTTTTQSTLSIATNASNIELPKTIVLNPAQSSGIAVSCQFRREMSTYSTMENMVRLFIKNSSNTALENINIDVSGLDKSRAINNFDPIASLAPDASTQLDLSIQFGLQTTELRFALTTKNRGNFNISITPTIGELLIPVAMQADRFKKEREQLSGFNQESAKLNKSLPAKSIVEKTLAVANVAIVNATETEQMFASKTRSKTGELVLIYIVKQGDTHTVNVHSEKNVLALSLCNDLIKSLSK